MISETPAEDVRNTLTVLAVAGEQQLVNGIAAVRYDYDAVVVVVARLTSALAKMERYSTP